MGDMTSGISILLGSAVVSTGITTRRNFLHIFIYKKLLYITM